MSILTAIERSAFLADQPGWEIDGELLRRTFALTDFVAAMAFVTQVAILAEKAFHHPDIDIRWNKVTLTLSTHDEGGLTSRDTELAAEIGKLGAGSS
ncbi:MAG: 4a-hydroxytetrahydrobiopterin dehydratase [Acidimicrobiia bacterium]|nr:4a-hydroxytetrahydrobiopterin dehydratase [Acidimicrobiia bacterium]